MTFSHQRHSVLLNKVFTLIEKRIPRETQTKIKHFANLLYQNMSSDDVEDRNVSDLYGATVSLWHTFAQYDKTAPHIRVYNPEIDKHGWHSTHTIVEIMVADMPFLVDSVRMALTRLNIKAHLFLHSPMVLERSSDHQIAVLHNAADGKPNAHKETVFLIEVDHHNSQHEIQTLTDELHSVVNEVSLTVSDWHPMRDKLESIIRDFKAAGCPAGEAVKNETIAFLTWLYEHKFTFMGYRHYSTKGIKGDFQWITDDNSSLGLMRNSTGQRKRLLSLVPASAREEVLSHKPLILTKTTTRARVHRPAHMDYIGIKEFDDKGHICGEHRFIGLYSAPFYNSSATELPVLREKIQRISALSGFSPETHAYKAVVNILETYPRDELLQTDESDLANIVLGIFQMQERGISRLFMRKDVFGRFFSCMVYVPRERYNTQLRGDIQALLARTFNTTEEVEFTTYFSESVYARTHYIARVKNNNADVDVKEIEKNIIELTKSWEDRLALVIRATYGEGKGKALENRYLRAFSRSYMENNLPTAALVDIGKLEKLSEANPLDMLYYRPQEEPNNSEVVKLKLFHKNEPIHLSDVLPMLENFGLRVVDERPYKIRCAQGDAHWVMDFHMLHKHFADLNMEQAQTLFQDAFAKVWANTLEDDAFNRLVLGAGLTGRRVTILRAYAKYMRQTGSSFSHTYIANTFSKYPQLAVLLVDLFAYRFDPDGKQNPKQIENTISLINEQLDDVSNLDDDRIIRRYVELICATLRTNFYQLTAHGCEKPYVSFKLQPDLLSDMPLPLPKFEVFVYSPRLEGVHLRGGKVARGGLRWSDRQEDFRTEVLGLVKAQQVKNTVIVPVGAKGGFVCKQLPEMGDRNAIFEEGKACYRTFIRSLLDITDNIVDGEIVPPPRVVRHDEDDPYLVVAADKGTATFSDIANGISQEYGFWLGDAFASGGSVGYDHKKMGITARGAWESVKRHFREIGVDCQTTEFTCVGVGDMGGDVFGNGMLLSEHTRIIAAFNHLHIFFDPSPDAAASYQERQRLFDDPRLAWSDYNTALISKGGGVFSRAAKSIPLSEEMRKWLDTRKMSMTPNELIHNILKMPVDLLWNGGIGTYVKGSAETHTEVGDRANDTVRINGNELRAKIVGEGGNLGLTQRGRIEYAANGGRANTDFIDNVGGVDCSDNEVNIKILLNALVNSGDLTTKQRNALLYDMTDDVANIVLHDCYRQTQSLSVTEFSGVSQLKEQLRFIHGLEREGRLNRELEFIPNDEELLDRVAVGKGLTRPELSVLIAYGKMGLKDALNIPEITDNPHHNNLLVNAFPPRLREHYTEQMQAHPLRGEIISTKLTNDLVNTMGLNFVYRTHEETGASIAEIANGYTIVMGIFDMQALWQQIEQLDNKVAAQVQLKILESARRLLRRSIRWYLRHGDKSLAIDQAIAYFQPAVRSLLSELQHYLVDEEYAQLQAATQSLVDEGVPQSVAYHVSSFSNLFSALDLAQIGDECGKLPKLTSRLYFQLGFKLELHWFLDQINTQPVNNHWQALARASYREELDWQQRSITTNLLASYTDMEDADSLLEKWMNDNESLLKRWYLMMSEFKTSSNHEFAKFSVALRELMLLSVKSNH